METHAAETLAADQSPSRECVQHVIALLERAVSQIELREETAQCTLRKASWLLRRQIGRQLSEEAANGRGRLLAWQARKVRDYIDCHFAARIAVADLSALVQLSEGHFSRSFKLTFGESPHSFVVRRRIEMAALRMLRTDECLTDIALHCGFSDQAHFCRHFRQAVGQSPAAWRRLRRTLGREDLAANASAAGMAAA